MYYFLYNLFHIHHMIRPSGARIFLNHLIDINLARQPIVKPERATIYFTGTTEHHQTHTPMSSSRRCDPSLLLCCFRRQEDGSFPQFNVDEPVPVKKFPAESSRILLFARPSCFKRSGSSSPATKYSPGRSVRSKGDTTYIFEEEDDSDDEVPLLGTIQFGSGGWISGTWSGLEND